MRGEERREEDRNGRPVKGVRGGRILARRFELTQRQERQRDEHTDGHAHGWLEPSLVDRVAQEEDGREHQRNARNAGKQLDANQAFPVEGWSCRRGRGRRWRRRPGNVGGHGIRRLGRD